MAASLAALLTPPTESGVLASLLSLWQMGGFPVTAWQSGNPWRTIGRHDAKRFVELGTQISDVAIGGYRKLAAATGKHSAWLDLIGENLYDLPRNAARKTQGLAVLTDTAGAGPFTIVPGQLLASNLAKTRFFRNITGGTLPAAGELDTLTWEATEAGEAWNLPPNALTLLSTTLPGVTINNPTPVGAETWITQVGTDAELDEAYSERMGDRWPTLGTGATADVYRFWARSANPEITRVHVSTLGNGRVDIILASAAGPVSAQALADAIAYIGTSRVPLCVSTLITSAVAQPAALAGTVYVKDASGVDVIASIQTALEALVRATDIGGTLYASAVLEELMRPDGVYDASYAGANVVAGAGQVITLAAPASITVVTT